MKACDLLQTSCCCLSAPRFKRASLETTTEEETRRESTTISIKASGLTFPSTRNTLALCDNRGMRTVSMIIIFTSSFATFFLNPAKIHVSSTFSASHRRCDHIPLGLPTFILPPMSVLHLLPRAVCYTLSFPRGLSSDYGSEVCFGHSATRIAESHAPPVKSAPRNF